MRHLKQSHKKQAGFFMNFHNMLIYLNIIAVASSITAPVNASVELKFSPNGGVADSIFETLSSATSTVDVALYSFSDRRLQDKLQAIAQNGIRVRLILHGAKSRAPLADKMEAAGIDVRYVTQVMHHKFAIIDYKENTSGATLITGSANWSSKSDTEYDEDFVIAKGEEALTQSFQAEFDHIWNHARVYGENAESSSRVAQPTPADSDSVFTSSNFEVYEFGANWVFRPLVEAQDGVAGAAIIAAINEANTSIKIATTHFRRKDIYDALVSAMKNRAVAVELITDQQEFRAERIPAIDPQDLYWDEKLANEGATVLYKTYMVKWSAPQAKQMHSKYIVIDNSKVLSGSFNWSKNSEVGSLENLTPWTDSNIVSSYAANFEAIRSYNGQDGLTGLLGSIGQAQGQGPCNFLPITLTGAQFSDVRKAYAPGACR